MNGNILLEVDAFAASRSLGGRTRSTNVKVTVNDNSDDLFDIPEPRWVCPPHIDVCAKTGVTLSRYMKEMVRVNPDLEEIESIFTSLQVACKTLSNLVRTSALSGLTGLEDGGGSINIQGEEQKKLDVIANDVLKNALRWSGQLSTIASEEEEKPFNIMEIQSSLAISSSKAADAMLLCSTLWTVHLTSMQVFQSARYSGFSTKQNVQLRISI